MRTKWIPSRNLSWKVRRKIKRNQLLKLTLQHKNLKKKKKKLECAIQSHEPPPLFKVNFETPSRTLTCICTCKYVWNAHSRVTPFYIVLWLNVKMEKKKARKHFIPKCNIHLLIKYNCWYVSELLNGSSMICSQDYSYKVKMFDAVMWPFENLLNPKQ